MRDNASEATSFPPAPHARASRVRAVGVAIGGALLVWMVISRTLVAYLAETAPGTALVLREADPVALVTLAARRIDREMEAGAERSGAVVDATGRLSRFSPAPKPGEGTPTPDDTPEAGRRHDLRREAAREAQTWARLALMSDPLNAQAFRVLGQASELADDDGVEALMERAARLSLHESYAVAWLLERRFESGGHVAVLRLADILLRTRPDLVAKVAPVLARIAEGSGSAGELEQLLGTNPPWRAAWLGALPTSASDARTMLHLLLALEKTATPPTSSDLRGYLNFLVRNKHYELAYYAWLQFLPADQLASAGLLFNGSFRHEPSRLPFDWVITPGSGATIDIGPHPDHEGERTLFLELGPGRVDLGGIAQTVLLAPGVYELTGQQQVRLVGPRGLRWRITCAGGAAKLGETDMTLTTGATWEAFAVSFTVPAEGCRAQQVRLLLDARSASEQLVTGVAWFADLRIVRQ